MVRIMIDSKRNASKRIMNSSIKFERDKMPHSGHLVGSERRRLDERS